MCAVLQKKKCKLLNVSLQKYGAFILQSLCVCIPESHELLKTHKSRLFYLLVKLISRGGINLMAP